MNDLEKIDKEYVLHTYNRNYVNFKKGINATLYDDKNKDYIDFTSGIGVVSVGHGNKKVASKIFEQISNLTHTSNLYLIEPQALLAKKIKELSTYDIRAFFANSGAEANEGALKIARTYGELNFTKKRYKIISLENSFHGRTISTVKASGQNSMHQSKFAPYPDGFLFVSKISDIYNSIDDETVGVMIELIQGEGGVLPFDKKEIQELGKFLKEKNILLIVDEVQTGVFRTGKFLASNVYEIEPDIITIAKGLGGGVPIGAVLTKHKDIFSPGDHGSTFGGNYLVTSASLQVLDILENIKKDGSLDNTIEYFSSKMQKIFKEHQKIFLSHTGIGLMRGLQTRDDETLSLIIKNAFECGVMVLKSGRNTLRFLPCLTISKNEIDDGFKRLEKSLLAIK